MKNAVITVAAVIIVVLAIIGSAFAPPMGTGNLFPASDAVTMVDPHMPTQAEMEQGRAYLENLIDKNK